MPRLRSVIKDTATHPVRAAADGTRRAAESIARRIDEYQGGARLDNSVPARVLNSLRARSETALPRRTALVPMDKLLLGGQCGTHAATYGRIIDDPTWSSTQLKNGPHASLYRLALEDPESLLPDCDLLATDYGQMAKTQLEKMSHYFLLTDGDAIRRHIERRVEEFRSANESGYDPLGESPSLPLVRPIRDSDCYEIVDGHHRLAQGLVLGATKARVEVTYLEGTTSMQDFLRSMSWLGSKKEIYQPLPFPEVASEWVLVRQCTDRLEKMLRFIREQGISSDGSYLDVASCYGWFVAEMAKEGFKSRGLERDPLGAELGEIAYGLNRDAIMVGDATSILEGQGKKWDIVSCFSLIHHFGLTNNRVGLDRFLRALDNVTGSVLFLDSGQEHERNYRELLKGWTTDGIRQMVLDATSFTDVTLLGPDGDGVGEYAGNYGRVLFAFTR